MKKVLMSALVLSTLISGGHAAEAKSAPLCKIERSTVHKFPNIEGQETVNTLKNATFKYKGVGIGVPMKEALKKLGNPYAIHYQTSELGKEVIAQYTNITVQAINQTGKGGFNEATVYGMSFENDGKVKTPSKTIKTMLGKPELTHKIENEVFDIYDKFTITYKMTKSDSVIKEITMLDESKIDFDHKEKLNSKINNKKEHRFTSKELLAMKDGKYNFYGLKLGMTSQQAKKIAGNAKNDTKSRVGNEHYINQSYGKDSFLDVGYESNDCGKTFNITNFMVGYEFAHQTLSDIEKVVGKPDTSEKGSYIEEMDGVKGKKIPTVMNEYGHLSLNAEKINGKWHVLDIQYVR